MAVNIPSPRKNETMSPEMDAWLKRAKKKHPEPEPSIDEIMSAPRRAAEHAIDSSAAHNSRLLKKLNNSDEQ